MINFIYIDIKYIVMKSAFIRSLDEELYRRFKSIAVLRGITVSEAFNEAMRLWIEVHESSLKSREDFDNEYFIGVRNMLDRKYRGKYVVIYEGELLGVAENLRGVYRIMDENGVERCMVYKAGVKEEGEWLWGSIEP